MKNSLSYMLCQSSARILAGSHTSWWMGEEGNCVANDDHFGNSNVTPSLLWFLLYKWLLKAHKSVGELCKEAYTL